MTRVVRVVDGAERIREDEGDRWHRGPGVVRVVDFQGEGGRCQEGCKGGR